MAKEASSKSKKKTKKRKKFPDSKNPKYTTFRCEGQLFIPDEPVLLPRGVKDLRSKELHIRRGTVERDILRIIVAMLVRAYPQVFVENDEACDVLKIRALNVHTAWAICDLAFKHGLLTRGGEKFESARAAWGSYAPTVYDCEIPDTGLAIEAELVEKINVNEYNKRCTYCAYRNKKRGMCWCDSLNKASKNVKYCPVGCGRF